MVFVTKQNGVSHALHYGGLKNRGTDDSFFAYLNPELDLSDQTQCLGKDPRYPSKKKQGALHKRSVRCKY
jgi:hypothetical protein